MTDSTMLRDPLPVKAHENENNRRRTRGRGGRAPVTLSRTEGAHPGRIPGRGRPALAEAAIEHVLEAMRCGGVENVMLVLSPAKAEVFRYLGSGQQLGLALAYLCQEEPLGIPHALDLAAPYVADATVCMGMPDTIFTPRDSFAQLLQFHRDHRSELSLGVFPTTEPQSLAPVIIEPGTRRVLAIVDKPASPPAANTWGIAVWSPAFTELLGGFVRAALDSRSGELLLSDAFIAAVEAGLRVHALNFEAGRFYDIGTPVGVSAPGDGWSPATRCQRGGESDRAADGHRSIWVLGVDGGRRRSCPGQVPSRLNRSDGAIQRHSEGSNRVQYTDRHTGPGPGRARAGYRRA